MTSPAWLCLDHSAARVLIDFIGVFYDRTNFDRDPTAAARPVLYSYGMCAVTLSKNTFYRALIQLQQHGFLQQAWNHKRNRGQMQRWIAIERWKYWAPDQAQLRVLNDYAARRASAPLDPNQLQLPFVQRLGTLNRATAPTPDNITHVSQVIETVLEAAWTKKDSRHQPPAPPTSTACSMISKPTRKRTQRTSFGE
jgi:hypothetical protein